MVRVIERQQDRIQRLDRTLERQVLEVAQESGIPVRETLAGVKETSTTRVVNAAKQVLSSALMADSRRRDGHSTLEMTTELLGAANDKPLAVAALLEMSSQGPDIFGSRVAGLHRTFGLLKAAEAVGGDDALQQLRKQTRHTTANLRLFEER